MMRLNREDDFVLSRPPAGSVVSAAGKLPVKLAGEQVPVGPIYRKLNEQTLEKTNEIADNTPTGKKKRGRTLLRPQ